METIGVVVNRDRDPDLVYGGQVRDYLTGKGFDVVLWGHEGHSHDMPVPTPRAVFWVVLGGDGTMLWAAHYAAVAEIPMIGINLGNLGFLTDVDKDHGLMAIEKVLSGKYEFEKRLMLEAEFGAGEIIPLTDRLALNEICIGTFGRLTELSIYVNEQHMDAIRADGLLISTPTGSTAYNLSAGGPILVPGGKMIVITPVCPHSLSARPWVIASEDIVRVVTRQQTPVVIDGVPRGMLQKGESVFIKASTHHAVILKTAPVNFYATLRKKKIL